MEAQCLSVMSTLEGVFNRDDDESIKGEAAFTRIHQAQAKYVMYTDGSAKSGTTMGGSAVVVTHGDPENPTYC